MSPSAARLMMTGGATLFLLVMWSAPAFGHAEFRTSEPAAGATIEAPPDRVVARFTEPPDGASKLVVVDPCGDRVDRGPTQTFGTQLGVETSSRFAGEYEVQYSVLSDLDGHPERGSFTFHVAEGEVCAEVAGGEDPVVESSLFDLPMGGFIAGIACAILIGGAAGYIYVSTGRS